MTAWLRRQGYQVASDESSFVTGITLTADGGLTLQSPEALVCPSFRRRWRDDVLVPVPEVENPYSQQRKR